MNSYNKNIVQSINKLFEVTDFHNNNNQLKNLVDQIQNCITSMNCFKLLLYESKLNSMISVDGIKYKSSKIKLKLNFSDEFFSQIKISNLNSKLYEELKSYYKSLDKFCLLVDENESFRKINYKLLLPSSDNMLEDMSSRKSSVDNSESHNFENVIKDILTKAKDDDTNLSEKFLTLLNARKESRHSNYPSEIQKPKAFSENNLITNFSTEFYIECSNKSIIKVDKKWNVNDLLREIKSVMLSESIEIQEKEITVKFYFKEIDNNKNSSTIKSSLMEYYTEKIISHYDKEVVNNPTIYLIKRLSPFIYVLAILDLAINKFENYFKNLHKYQIEKSEAGIELNNFENKKISSLIMKQSKDTYSVSTSSVPGWCKAICGDFNFICSFNSRYLLFKVATFDSYRSVYNLNAYMKGFHNESLNDEKNFGVSKEKIKVSIDRSNIYKSALQVYRNEILKQSYLEFEFMGEVGTGLGPSLEFYTLFYENIRLMEEIWYKTDDKSLYPLPSFTPSLEMLEIFEILGFIIARAIYDDRIIDFQLSSVFWDLVLERHVNINSLVMINSSLFKFIKQLESNIFSNKINQDLQDSGISFILPGYPKIELIENGDDILLENKNAEEYVLKIYDLLLNSGVNQYIERFKFGFNKVFEIASLKLFTSKEIETILCGNIEEEWDTNLLTACIATDHGYSKKSKVFEYLLKYMLGLSFIEKKKFLTFITGAPRLPLGGIKNLRPKLTLVKTPSEPKITDSLLPTVMT